MTSARDRYRIGFDIGGTFTDFVLHDTLTGRIRIHKCLTTPKDPSAGALDGLEELLRAAGLRFSDLGQLVHGTTLVTNAIIERHGATLGLLTTRGFRDTLEMGIEQRYDIYDLFLKFPEPLARRALRREIDERVSRDGVVLTPIDLEDVRRVVADNREATLEAGEPGLVLHDRETLSGKSLWWEFTAPVYGTLSIKTRPGGPPLFVIYTQPRRCRRDDRHTSGSGLRRSSPLSRKHCDFLSVVRPSVGGYVRLKMITHRGVFRPTQNAGATPWLHAGRSDRLHSI